MLQPQFPQDCQITRVVNSDKMVLVHLLGNSNWKKSCCLYSLYCTDYFSV